MSTPTKPLLNDIAFLKEHIAKLETRLICKTSQAEDLLQILESSENERGSLYRANQYRILEQIELPSQLEALERIVKRSYFVRKDTMALIELMLIHDCNPVHIEAVHKSSELRFRYASEILAKYKDL